MIRAEEDKRGKKKHVMRNGRITEGKEDEGLLFRRIDAIER